MDDYAKDIDNIEFHHVLNFFEFSFDKKVANSTTNSAKCAVTTILDIPTYPPLKIHWS